MKRIEVSEALLQASPKAVAEVMTALVASVDEEACESTLERVLQMHQLQSVEAVDLNTRHAIKKPRTFDRVGHVMLWAQIEGQSVLRLGGWRERQQRITTIRSGQVVSIFGQGKRALEATGQGASTGLLAVIRSQETSGIDTIDK